MIVFPQARVLYETVMYSLILIIGALVGMEIPILTSILSQKQNIRDSISNVMSFDYLGALVGAVAFPLFLLPHLGLIRASFAIGLINGFIALINIFMFRKYLRRPGLFMAAALSVTALLVAFLLYGSVLTRFAEKHLYFDDIIYQQQTRYQKIVVTRSAASGDTRLYIDGHIQFSSRDEYRYHEALVHPLMSIPGDREHILILGGGDGLAAREVLKHQDVRTIHLVDIDPEMTQISKQLPVLSSMNANSLDDPRLSVFNDDAFSFINQPGMLYDRVIIDMPDPHNEAINKLYSREFYTMIRRRMTPQGVLVTQSSSPFFTRKTFWCIEQTLASVFEHTLSYHNTIPSFGVWGFNMARNGAPLPHDYDFEIPTRYLDRAVMDAALIFGKDTQKLPSPVNSILEPKLY
jgi:spermidine synthase